MNFKQYLISRIKVAAAQYTRGQIPNLPDQLALQVINCPPLRDAETWPEFYDNMCQQNFNDEFIHVGTQLWRKFEKARHRAEQCLLNTEPLPPVRTELRAELKKRGYQLFHRGNGKYWVINNTITLDATQLAMLCEANKQRDRMWTADD